MRDKFIFFIHVHKCAGTSVIDLFSKQDGVTMIQNWKRVNAIPPYLKALRKIETRTEFKTKYSKKELANFVERMRGKGVNFVATEWAIPEMSCLPFGKEYFYFTVLRDPFERYLSNFYFDIERGYRKVESIYDYPDGKMMRELDYYTRLFSSYTERQGGETSKEDVDQALRLLDRFDAIVIQEMPETFRTLEKLNIDVSKLERKNTTKKSQRVYPEGFKDYFMKNSKNDYVIYNRAIEIAQSQMN